MKKIIAIALTTCLIGASAASIISATGTASPKPTTLKTSVNPKITTAPKTSSTSKPTAIASPKTNPAKGESAVKGAPTGKTATSPTPTRPKSTNEYNADGTVKLKIRTRPLPLTLDPPRADFADEKIKASLYALPTLGQTSYKDFKIQPIKVSRDANHVSVTFEFANLSSKPITLSKKNIYFSLSLNESGKPSDRTEFVGGSLTVKPKEIQSFTVRAHPRAVLCEISINGQSGLYSFKQGDPDSPKISDTKPEVRFINFGYPEASALLSVAGNGKLKFQATERIMINNDELMEFRRKGDTNATPALRNNGTLGLVKIRLANTSNETLKIEKIEIGVYNQLISQWATDYLDLDLLSEFKNPLPLIVKPQSIVEGYLPYSNFDTYYRSYVFITSNLGEFSIDEIQTY